MKTALIVDDQEENLYYLDALLTANGWEVVSARHGAEALAKARQRPPAVVISDLLMPVMDGYTLLRHWKADGALRAAPFIVYTATYTEPEDERLALNLGADAFILKPAEPDVFMARLQAVLTAANTAAPVGSRAATGDDELLLREYSEILIRKLEQKTLALEEANQTLQRDIAAREEAEAALRAAEERLREAQKMEAVGRLAGGIAHDFNNLLTVIIGYSNVALQALPQNAPLREDIDEIRRAGERAADLTRQLLAFGRRQVLRPAVVDLGAIVLDMERLLRRLLGEDIRLAVLVDRPSGAIFADKSQVEQIVMNIAVNARDAMPGGGSMTLAVTDVEVGVTEAMGLAEMEPGPYVRLTAMDTGAGMDRETLERIFEPFFTTKELGQGTGLGLSTVFGIIKQSGGHVVVDSQPGAGTTFSVYFPRTNEPVDVDPIGPAPSVTLRGSETILLVEDDHQVRGLNRTVLERHGYRVLDAQSGPDGIATSDGHEGRIDLLLTDVVMPGMSGPQLAERLAATRPEMRVLYVSGYAQSVIGHHGELDPDVQFLQKPVTPNELLRKVRDVVDVPAPSRAAKSVRPDPATDLTRDGRTARWTAAGRASSGRSGPRG